jgi:hypothetical protein
MEKRRLACALAAVAAGSLLAAGAALAQSGGGVGIGDEEGGGQATSSDRTYYNVQFGARNLWRGHRGEDVKTLQWLLSSNALGGPHDGSFRKPTDGLVRRFQAGVGLRASGVVRKGTRKAFARRMPLARATWYGPGFWGNRTACGRTLRKRTIGVAHRRLPCGTRVVFAFRGRWVRARVIDRGPYRRGYRWDLTRGLAKRLGFLRVGTGKLRRAVVG